MKILGQTNLMSKKLWVHKNFSLKDVISNNFLLKKISDQTFLGPKNLGQNKVRSKKVLVLNKSASTNIRSKKILVKKKLRYCSYRQMFHGLICFQKYLKMVPEIYLQSLVKLRSVTAEIFLILTNVAWTNVTMTVGIWFRCSQGPTFKV